MKTLAPLFLSLALAACTEPQRDPLAGTWQGTVAAHTGGPSRTVTVTVVGEDNASIIAAGGLACSTANMVGSPPSVYISFTSCISAPAHPVVTLEGTLSGDAISGTLSGWEFNKTPITLTRR